MTTDIPATSDTPETPKKDNKKLFIIVGIVAAILLCICSIAGITLLMNSNSDANDAEDFTILLETYLDNADKIDAKWDTESDFCDTSEEYSVLLDAEYYEDELDQLFIDVDDSVSREWACYKEIREYELELDTAQSSDFDDIDCDKLNNPEQCKSFIDDFKLLLTNEQAAIDLFEKDYQNWKDDDVCFLTSFQDNFDDDAQQDIDDAICTDNATDLTDELTALEDEYGMLVDNLREIADEYLSTDTE